MRKKKNYAKNWVERASKHFQKCRDTIYKWERANDVKLLEFLKQDLIDQKAAAEILKKEIADMKDEKI